jgi:hypothetical protein
VEAECYQLTRAIAFVRARAYQASDDRTIASSVATFMLGANRAAPPGFGSDSGSGSGSASGLEGAA